MSAAALVRRSPWLQRALWVPLQMRRVIKQRLDRPYIEAVEEFIAMLDGDVALRVTEFDGTFRMSPRSDLFRRLARYRCYESSAAAFYRQAIMPDRDIIDVGANIGFFTILGARQLLSGRVLAIEPVAAAHERLTENVARNGVSDHVILFRGAAGAQTGEVVVNIVADREEYSSIGDLQHPAVKGATSHREVVAVRTIDSLVVEHGLQPALIKVDVEGAEGLVFAGAADTLTRFRPTVISELSQKLLSKMGTDAQKIVSMFRNLDYLVTDAVDLRFPPGKRDFGDIFCIPRERVKWQA